MEELRARMASLEALKKTDAGKEIMEHPFGTMKRAFNQGRHLLLK